jgi:hypothetical protein
MFVDSVTVTLSNRKDAEIRYTLDGTEPTRRSPVYRGPFTLRGPGVVKAACFGPGNRAGAVAVRRFEPIAYQAARPAPPGLRPGLRYDYFEGAWEKLPDFTALKPRAAGGVPSFSIGPRLRDDDFGFVFTGWLRVPEDGVYTFTTSSDDGHRLVISGAETALHDGLHGMEDVSSPAALRAGWHPVRLEFFEHTGGEGLAVAWSGPGFEKRPLGPESLFRAP